MGTTVKEFNLNWWAEVQNHVMGAVVFLDDASAECLHWYGGYFNLMGAGALMVKSLATTEACPKMYRKAVFLTQATLTQLTAIQAIVVHSDLTHCTVISCVSLDVVFLELNVGKDVSDVVAAGKAPQEAAKMLEDMIGEWIGKTQCAINVIHIPIFSISLTPVIFTTPPYQSIYPSIDGNLITTPVADLYQISSDERSRVRRVASGLNSLMDSMNLKDEIYFMGAYSSLVASVLENSPVCLNRRKHAKHPATLIIIDRTLDVVGVTSHSTESVLDKVMAVLPRYPGHGNEVAVDMSALCTATAINHPKDLQLSAGCLYHALNEGCTHTYENMIYKSQKEVMLDLYNKLSKIDVEKSPSPKNLLKVTPQSIEKIVNATKGHHTTILAHLGLLQQALAIVQTLKSPRRPLIELLQGLEKQVIESLTASRDSTSILYQITHLIRTRVDRNIPLESLLALIVHIYSLISSEASFSQEHEENLIDTLSVAVYEDQKTLFRSDTEPTVVLQPEDGVDRTYEMMKRLKTMAMMRKHMQKYSSVLKPSESGHGEEYKGLLQQLVEDLVSSNRPELPDLTHRSEGIKDLILSGLGMLTKKARVSKHPMDNPLVIVFVIGGFTAEECKRLHRSVITSGVDNTVMFGATRLVCPVEAMRDVLGI